MYLLDTNVISELRKPRPHGGVLAWLKTVRERDLHISAVSFGEIQAGIENVRARDPVKAADLEIWADALPGAWSVLPMDHISFRRWATLMFRKSDTLTGDAMIAAIAIQHNLTVVTRNVKDFESFGVALLNPFTTR